jgi:hypothetical protein
VDSLQKLFLLSPGKSEENHEIFQDDIRCMDWNSFTSSASMTTKNLVVTKTSDVLVTEESPGHLVEHHLQGRSHRVT